MKTILSTIVLFLALNCNAQKTAEPLLGFLHDQNGVVFQVYSGGCTDKNSFVVEHSVVDKEKVITLMRVRPDYCKAFFFFGTYVDFTYDELGIDRGEQFSIQNLVVGSRRPNF